MLLSYCDVRSLLVFGQATAFYGRRSPNQGGQRTRWRYLWEAQSEAGRTTDPPVIFMVEAVRSGEDNGPAGDIYGRSSPKRGGQRTQRRYLWVMQSEAGRTTDPPVIFMGGAVQSREGNGPSGDIYG